MKNTILLFLLFSMCAPIFCMQKKFQNIGDSIKNSVLLCTMFSPFINTSAILSDAAIVYDKDTNRSSTLNSAVDDTTGWIVGGVVCAVVWIPIICCGIKSCHAWQKKYNNDKHEKFYQKDMLIELKDPLLEHSIT